MGCSGSMKAHWYVGFCIVGREDLCERTPDAIRCTGQDGSPAVLLTGCMHRAEVKWHFADVVRESLIGENRGKIWALVLLFSRRNQRDRRFTDNAKRMSTGLAEMKTQRNCKSALW